MFFGVQFIKIFQMLFNKKYCFKNLSFFSPTPHEKIVIRTESWVKNRDTNRIVGLVYRYSPNVTPLCTSLKYLSLCGFTIIISHTQWHLPATNALQDMPYFLEDSSYEKCNKLQHIYVWPGVRKWKWIGKTPSPQHIMLWECVSTSGPGGLVRWMGEINVPKHSEILEKKTDRVCKTPATWKKICYPARQWPKA